MALDWSPIVLTAQISASATLISVASGTLVAWWLRRARFPGRSVLSALILMPLLLPPTVLGYYLLVVMGRNGIIGQVWESVFGSPLVFTRTAAVVAACVSCIPIVVRQLAAAFGAIDEDVVEAARLDGADGWKLFVWVYLPILRGSIAAAAAIAFARAVGDFGATLMVAGNIPGRTQTASLAIYDLMNSPRPGAESEALVLVLIVSAIALAVLVLTTERQQG